MIYLQLFWEFFKTGLFSVGGGLATLPFLYEMQARTGWFTVADLSNMIAVSESTPGPMGINMATFTGFTVAGIPGGIVAVAGEICPAFLIIIAIYRLLDRFKTNRYVQYALYGLRAASAALILVAGLRVAEAALLNVPAWTASGAFTDLFRPLAIALAVTVFLLYRRLGKHPLWYILASGLIGVLLKL
ncbi:MAG: chromate transporter [Oscillospiraceae bacterium]|nr:chromate transporter [Oscillospiraceae bacterium]